MRRRGPTKIESGLAFMNYPLLKGQGWMLGSALAIAGVIFFFNLGDAPLWDRDEPRNAGCAVEMMRRSDWVVPIFNDELRFQKPVLLYWLMMSAYNVWGVNEFAARFWSALLAVGTVSVTFGIAKQLFNVRVAFLSGVILCSNLMFVVAARAATPDSALIFFSTAAIGCWVWGSNRNRGSGGRVLCRSFKQLSPVWLLSMAVCMGLGMLAKGPVAFVMPMAIMGLFLLVARQANFHPHKTTAGKPTNTQRPLSVGDSLRRAAKAVRPVVNPVHFVRTTFAMRPFLLLGLGLLIAAPWYVWAGARTDGDFLHIFFLSEHFGRATTAFENHRGGVWFYPVAILAGFFPWSLFWLPVTVILYRSRKKWGDGVGLMLCWIGVQVAVFSIAQTKLPSYVTPCYPALAMLTARCLQIWIQREVVIATGWMYAVMLTAVGVGGGWIAVGVVVAIYYLPGLWSLPLIGAVIVISGAYAILKLRQEKIEEAVTCFAVGAVVFVSALFGVGASDLATAQDNQKILNKIASLPHNVGVASFQCLESTWPFYSGRTIYETRVDARPKCIARNKFWKPKPVTTPESFAMQHQQCVFITTDQWAATLIERLGDRYEALETADYLFKNRKLVLVGPAGIFSALPQDARRP